MITIPGPNPIDVQPTPSGAQMDMRSLVRSLLRVLAEQHRRDPATVGDRLTQIANLDDALADPREYEQRGYNQRQMCDLLDDLIDQAGGAVVDVIGGHGLLLGRVLGEYCAPLTPVSESGGEAA